MSTTTNKPMPHIGTLLQNVMNEKRYNQVQLASGINVAPMTIWRMLKQQSIQADFLWRMGETLNVNFFQILANQHPVQTPTAKEIELQKQVNDLQIRIDIYKELLGKEK